MSASPIRWGILGAGIIPPVLAEVGAQDPDSELIAVASRTTGKAADFVARHGIAAASYAGALLAGHAKA